MSHINIVDFSQGISVEGNYILLNTEIKHARDGRTFMKGLLTDASGTMTCICFNGNPEELAAYTGSVVTVEGKFIAYYSILEFQIQSIQTAENVQDEEWSILLPQAPVDSKTVMNEMMDLVIHNIDDEEYFRLCMQILMQFSNVYCTYPAGMYLHHAYPGGLGVHTLNVMKNALSCCENYKNYCFFSKSLLMAGALLHDIGKVSEFNISRFGLVECYSCSGKKLGHSYLGARMVEAIGQDMHIDQGKLENLVHIILAHHGSTDKGAAVEPQCIEAMLLSYCDGLDSNFDKMCQSLEVLAMQDFGTCGGKRIFRVT